MADHYGPTLSELPALAALSGGLWRTGVDEGVRRRSRVFCVRSRPEDISRNWGVIWGNIVPLLFGYLDRLGGL